MSFQQKVYSRGKSEEKSSLWGCSVQTWRRDARGVRFCIFRTKCLSFLTLSTSIRSSEITFSSNRTEIFPLAEDFFYRNSFSFPEHKKVEIMELPLKYENNLSPITLLISSLSLAVRGLQTESPVSAGTDIQHPRRRRDFQ